MDKVTFHFSDTMLRFVDLMFQQSKLVVLAGYHCYKEIKYNIELDALLLSK